MVLVAKFHISIAWQGNAGKLCLERSVMHIDSLFFSRQRRNRIYFSVDHLGTLLKLWKLSTLKPRSGASRPVARGCDAPPKSAKRSTFSHKVGQKWGFCRRVRGVRFKKVHFLGPKDPLFGGPAPPPKSILAMDAWVPG